MDLTAKNVAVELPCSNVRSKNRVIVGGESEVNAVDALTQEV